MSSIETIEALINEKFDRNDVQHNEIIKRLDKTNGNVSRNTKFRWLICGGLTVVSFLGISSFLGVIALWLKVFNI